MAAMSIFPICIIASKARLAAARSGSAIAAIRARGVICHDSPHLSLHQPHALSWPPLPTMAFHKRSVSAWSSVATKRKSFRVLEGGAAVQPEARYAHDSELDRQDIALLAGRVVAGRHPVVVGVDHPHVRRARENRLGFVELAGAAPAPACADVTHSSAKESTGRVERVDNGHAGGPEVPNVAARHAEPVA